MDGHLPLMALQAILALSSGTNLARTALWLKPSSGSSSVNFRAAEWQVYLDGYPRS